MSEGIESAGTGEEAQRTALRELTDKLNEPQEVRELRREMADIAAENVILAARLRTATQEVDRLSGELLHRRSALTQGLRNLARKWVAQGRHPMRADRPGERELLEKCAAQLERELRDHG